MKHTTIVLTLLALTFVMLNLACQKEGSVSTTSSTPTPIKEYSPLPSPTPDKPRSGDLVEATTSGDIGYELAGVGNSTKMNLDVQNKTERVWEVKIEAGTKVEPDDSNIQQMVVTKEYEIHLEPHEHHGLEIEVSCLDISKAVPSSTNTGWQIESSKNLAQFLRCANDVVDNLIAEGEIKEEGRRGLIQSGLWQARGATHDDWIEYYEHYRKFNSEQAERAIEATAPLIGKVTGRCPSL